MYRLVVVTACLVLILGQAGFAQAKKAPKKVAKKADPVISITAEDLVKECKADEEKANEKYQNKMIRVTGVVGSIFDDLLYLPVQLKPGESSINVVVRFDAANKPAVTKDEKATFEGRFDRVAVLGPAIVECKLVKDEPTDEKPAPKGKTSKKKGG